MNTSIERRITVGICESQPLVVAGLRAVTEKTPNVTLLEPVHGFDDLTRLVAASCPRVLGIDKSLGVPAVMDFLTRMRDRTPTAFVVWGSSMTEPEAMRFLKAGARGVLRKTADPATVLACFEAVAGGGSWLEETLFHHAVRRPGHARTDLTVREQQRSEERRVGKEGRFRGT